ncbi:MAG TPA: hypothetical protein VKA74_16500, partial [Myxococcota bacterium]|nr:hypothetical protein [Myxococcota bacterium]
YAGVSLSLWEAPSVEAAEALRRSLAERDLAASMTGPGPSLCLVLEPEPLPPDSPSASEGPESLARRVLVIGFYPEDPADSVRRWTREVSDRVERAVGGRLLFSAPFIPTIPGTDRYADELW